jgi:DNA-binding NtrC family response regulator
MKKPAVLIVSCDQALRQKLINAILCHGFECIESIDISSTLRCLESSQPDIVLVGVSQNDPSESLVIGSQIRRLDVRIPLVFITKFTSEELAIRALRAGFNDYFKEPLLVDELLHSMQERLSPHGTVSFPRQNGGVNSVSECLVGESTSMKEMKTYIAKVAKSDSTVLITGETGTGKELVASLIHQNSSRSNRPFVCINCAAIPDTLFESELFGYERGAFTGAVGSKKGELETAENGTVFLDEIGDLAQSAQAKILRAIEMREFQRLGSRKSVSFSGRVIAATNQNLERAMQEQRFRDDLYYRINIARIHIPPLRERKEDIPALLAYYIRQMNRRFMREVEGLTDEAIECLTSYPWPGNIRELRNLVEAVFVGHPSTKISPKDFPSSFCERISNRNGSYDDERQRIMSALLATQWNMSKAAQKLQWSRMTLYRKMARHHVSRESQSEQLPASAQKKNSVTRVIEV